MNRYGKTNYANSFNRQQEEALANEFKRAVLTQDLSSPAKFAAPYRDLKSDAFIQLTVADVMAESLDYTSGPSLKDVFNVVIATALGKVVTGEAKSLIDRMAAAYASINYEPVNEEEFAEAANY